MKLSYLLTISLLLIGSGACALTLKDMKLSPEYKGVDPKAVTYVNEWLSLAKDHGLKFDSPVTIGFKNIDKGLIIGMCYYGSDWREIDLDISYWRDATINGRTALVFHELTHCYCTRGHDYADGKPYKEQNKSRNDPQDRDGFFADDCPTSIMFPVMVDDECFLHHYHKYTNEMFERCVEW